MSKKKRTKTIEIALLITQGTIYALLGSYKKYEKQVVEKLKHFGLPIKVVNKIVCSDPDKLVKIGIEVKK